jgi:hypothetical protein
MSLSRCAMLVVFSGGLVAPVVARPADPAPYAVIATLPDVIGGQALHTLVFDPVGKRLYAGSQIGLYWCDLSEATPRMKGPLFRKNIRTIEVAPDLGRVFYATPDEIGYADVGRDGAPVHLANIWARALAYEPTRHELYVASRAPVVQVFDARSGEHGVDVSLPGWYGAQLEPIPGRVFLSVGGKDGLYAIDAATHQVAPWPVVGRVVTPATIEADPGGRYLFLAYYREIVAIDVATATVTGRVVMASTPAIAFDPGTGLLLATWHDDSPPPIKVVAFRVDATGLIAVAQLPNPPIGGVGVEPTSHGFIQAGYHGLLVWSSERTAAPR